MNPSSTLRASERFGNFFVGEFQDVSHQHSSRLLLGQPQQRSGDVVMQLLSVQPLVNRAVFRVNSIEFDEGRLARCTTQSGPQRVASTIQTNPQNKRLGSWMPLDPRPPFPNDGQGLLQDIFGVLDDPRDSPD
jgi:hypothetical protein